MISHQDKIEASATLRESIKAVKTKGRDLALVCTLVKKDIQRSGEPTLADLAAAPSAPIDNDDTFINRKRPSLRLPIIANGALNLSPPCWPPTLRKLNSRFRDWRCAVDTAIAALDELPRELVDDSKVPENQKWTSRLRRCLQQDLDGWMHWIPWIDDSDWENVLTSQISAAQAIPDDWGKSLGHSLDPFVDELSWIERNLAPLVEVTDDDAEPQDNDEKLKQMPRAERLAYLAYKYVESKAGRLLKDRDAYDNLQDEGISDDGGDRGALDDYSLPSFPTWSRQLRAARKSLGEQKNTPRAGRSTGPSVVRNGEI